MKRAIACALLLSFAGCSKLVEVEGTVTLDGKPVEHGAVTFMPLEHGSPPAVSPLVEGGKFRLDTRNKQGAMRGKYKVVISSTAKGREMLPPAYSSTQKSVLTFEIPPGGSRDVHFELDSKGTPPPMAEQ